MLNLECSRFIEGAGIVVHPRQRPFTVRFPPRFSPSCHLPPSVVFATLATMLKKTLPFLLLALLAGCATQVTTLTPHVQSRNPNSLYPVEVAFASKQQNIRWETVKPTVIVNGQPFEMHPTLMMTNRWEGL